MESRDGLVARGTPTAIGSFALTVLAVHSPTPDGCSIMPDPHRFRIDVIEKSDVADAGAAEADAGVLPPPPK